MKSFISLVALLVVVGISSIPCHVEGKVLTLKASKDSTLYFGARGICNFATSKVCTNGLTQCPWCNDGKGPTLTIQRYEVQSDAIVGFSLKKVKKAIKSCKLILPAAVAGGPSPGKGANLKLTAVGFKWAENKITYENQPKATTVGSYGRVDPSIVNVVDITRSCVRAQKNRKASGNGVAISLTMDNTGIPTPYYVIEYPSREMKKSLLLQVTY